MVADLKRKAKGPFVYIPTANKSTHLLGVFTQVTMVTMCTQVVRYLKRKAKGLFVYKDSTVWQPPSALRDTTRYYACDTEVAFLDIKSDSPVSTGDTEKKT